MIQLNPVLDPSDDIVFLARVKHQLRISVIRELRHMAEDGLNINDNLFLSQIRWFFRDYLDNVNDILHLGNAHDNQE
jgi:hypothetical protein